MLRLICVLCLCPCLGCRALAPSRDRVPGAAPGARAVVERVARAMRERDLPTLGLLFAPECRYHCRGFVPLVLDKGGGYEAAAWIPRVDEGPLLMDLARILASYRPGLHASITPLRMRVLTTRVLLRARLRLEGLDLEGYRRVDEGLLDLHLRRGPSGWKVFRFRPAGVNTLRMEPDGSYSKRSLGKVPRHRRPGRRSLVPPGRHGTPPSTVGDVDGDGTLDRVTARDGWIEVARGRRGGYSAPRRLLRQLHVRCLEAADLNGDGRTDLFAGSYGVPSRLFLGGESGLGRAAAIIVEGHVTAAAAADFNRDGFVDLYVVRHGDPSSWPRAAGERDLLLLGGRRIRAEEVGAPGWGLAACAGDLDGDGAPDLWVANELEAGWLLINKGRGRLVDRALQAGVGHTHSTACAMGDVDGDGRIDLFTGGRRGRRAYLFGRPGVGAPGGGLVATRAERRRSARATRGDVLWLNRTAGSRVAFIARGAALLHTGWTSWAGMVDHDSDGRLDLLVLRNEPPAAVEERFWWEVMDPALRGEQPLELWGALAPARPRLWVNLGPRGSRCCRFVDGASVVDLDPAATALVHDHDGDGAPEVVLGGAGRVLGWRGEREAGHGVLLQLVGRRPNRRGLGSRVTLSAEGRRQVREVGCASGLPGGAPGWVHFGVGDAVRAQWVVVRWPDGTVQRFVDLPVDRRVRLTQGGHAAWGDRLAPPASRPAPERPESPGKSWTAPARLLSLTVTVGDTTRALHRHAGKRGTVVLFLGAGKSGGFACEKLAQLAGRHPGVAGVAVTLGPTAPPCALTASPATREAMRGGGALLPLLAVVDAAGRTRRLWSGPPDEDQLEAVLRGLRR